MPRKQNGFGKADSLAFKGAGRVDKGKGVGSFGVYPSNRRYGTTVQRTNFEDWDLDADWTKWRKGYEIYNKALFTQLRVEREGYNSAVDTERYERAQLLSILYQGTDYPTNVLFEGYAFPTLKADTNTHYVATRTPLEFDIQTGDPVNIGLGFINSITIGEEQRKYNEVWVQGIPDPVRGELLLQMVNERLTDGETEATMKNLLFFNPAFNRYEPGIYYGQTAPKSVRENEPEAGLLPTQVKITIPLADIQPGSSEEKLYRLNQGLSSSSVIKPTQIDVANNPEQLVGKIIYIPDFFKSRPVSNLRANIWEEDNFFMAAYINDADTTDEVFALDPGVSLLPPSLYDINSLPTIFKATNAVYEISGTYVFRKSDYQRFFGTQYLVADMVKDRVETASYSVLPFEVIAAEVVGNNLVVVSNEFESEILMHPPLSVDGVLVFSKNSFAKRIPSNNSRFRYALQTDVDPYMDEIFKVGSAIKPSITYTCSCPSHSKSILYAPQATTERGERKQNRQRRYPLPTSQSSDRYEGAGAEKAAGKISSWERKEDRQSLKLCKHSVAAMFADGIKVIEPSQYPSTEARIAFDSKLKKELGEYDKRVLQRVERGEIGLTEIVFALAQGLNLDNVETAYVVLNSN